MAKTSTRLRAEDYYVENIGATFKEIAELFKVTEKTVGTWASKYDWEEKQLDFWSSPTKIRRLLQKELLSIASGNKPSLPADAISKLQLTIDRIKGKLNPTLVCEFLKYADNYIAERDPELAMKVAPYHKEILIKKIEEYV